jgi:hypothetical protein
MKAIWLARSSELASRMRFWTAIVGYDPRDHSLSHRLYLVYVVIFFSLWGFSILVLLADVGTWILSFLGGLPPAIAAVTILAVVLLLDAVGRGYKACRRSPFVFSEEDAELICQTPVDRRLVALIWLLGDWLPTCLPFVALAVVFRFSSLQLAEQGPFLWSYLPRYWLAAFRVTTIMLPLHLALMAGGYALGALRLREARDIPALGWIPVGFALIMISLVFTNQGFLGIALWPVIFPLVASFGGGNWLFGFIIAAILTMVGLLTLYLASPRLNLSRAAQESGSRWASQQVRFLGDSRLAQRMKIRDRLGVQHPPSGIPGRAGAWSLIWKDGVISLRTFNFGKLAAWLVIFGASVGMVVAPDWGTRFWALIIWCLFVGQRGTERFRSDLELWVISQQLPFSRRVTMAAEIVLPILLSMLITWLAIGVGSLFGFYTQAYFILLSPPAIICTVLAAMYDILRKCHSSELLAGQVAEAGVGGLILGGLFAGLPMIIVYWLTNQSTSFGVNLMVGLFGSALGMGVSYLLWQFTASVYRGIK